VVLRGKTSNGTAPRRRAVSFCAGGPLAARFHFIRFRSGIPVAAASPGRGYPPVRLVSAVSMQIHASLFSTWIRVGNIDFFFVRFKKFQNEKNKTRRSQNIKISFACVFCDTQGIYINIDSL
jgi:hypothetical protein